jgi:hypothetical protein
MVISIEFYLVIEVKIVKIDLAEGYLVANAVNVNNDGICEFFGQNAFKMSYHALIISLNPYNTLVGWPKMC